MPVKRRQGANIRVVGTKAEIADILTALSDKGFTWRSNECFYPRIGEPDLYSYYLENLGQIL
jgi:hypothetical protein